MHDLPQQAEEAYPLLLHLDVVSYVSSCKHLRERETLTLSKCVAHMALVSDFQELTSKQRKSNASKMTFLNSTANSC